MGRRNYHLAVALVAPRDMVESQSADSLLVYAGGGAGENSDVQFELRLVRAVPVGLAAHQLNVWAGCRVSRRPTPQGSRAISAFYFSDLFAIVLGT